MWTSHSLAVGKCTDTLTIIIGIVSADDACTVLRALSGRFPSYVRLDLLYAVIWDLSCSSWQPSFAE